MVITYQWPNIFPDPEVTIYGFPLPSFGMITRQRGVRYKDHMFEALTELKYVAIQFNNANYR